MVGFVRFENDQIEQFMFCPTDNTATSLSVTEIPLFVVTIIRNTGGAEIFRTHPHRPWGSPSLLYDGVPAVFPGGPAAGAGR
jgi:hypothetical protein